MVHGLKSFKVDKEFINFLTNVNVIVPDIERLFQIISAASILVLFFASAHDIGVNEFIGRSY